MGSGHGSRWGLSFQMGLGLVFVLGWVLSEGHGSWVMGHGSGSYPRSGSSNGSGSGFCPRLWSSTRPSQGNHLHHDHYLGSRIGIA